MAAALDKDENGVVCDWIREVLRNGFSIGVYAIQEDISPRDLDMFEQYWIEQFPKLLNSGSRTRRKATVTAQKIIEAVQSKLPKRRRKLK